MRRGGIEVESRVLALQDGVAGQQVRVRDVSGTAPISVRVVAAGQVEGE
jgi:flagella basal body P-ring formation protein FlgA